MSFLEYAPAPESRAILNLRDEYGLFIDGEFRPASGESFATISPAEACSTSMRSNPSKTYRRVTRERSNGLAPAPSDPGRRALARPDNARAGASARHPVAGLLGRRAGLRADDCLHALSAA